MPAGKVACSSCSTSPATYLVLAATAHDALQGFTDVMVIFVLPLVCITLIVFAVFELGLLHGRRLARAEAARDATVPDATAPGTAKP